MDAETAERLLREFREFDKAGRVSGAPARSESDFAERIESVLASRLGYSGRA
jgi:hypothetical protein